MLLFDICEEDAVSVRCRSALHARCYDAGVGYVLRVAGVCTLRCQADSTARKAKCYAYSPCVCPAAVMTLSASHSYMSHTLPCIYVANASVCLASAQCRHRLGLGLLSSRTMLTYAGPRAAAARQSSA
eukprot:3416201-Rhodomonas_salina.2